MVGSGAGAGITIEVVGSGRGVELVVGGGGGMVEVERVLVLGFFGAKTVCLTTTVVGCGMEDVVAGRSPAVTVT